MERYLEINKDHHNIRCKLYYNKIPEIRRVVIFCHGFAGHKDNAAAQKFAGKVLTKYKDVAVFIFNWPCHGDDVKKKLVLEDCMTYLGTVIGYVREQYAPEKLYAYATSFGGYLVLKYIMDSGNSFDRIALRCPAVNMYQVLTDIIEREEGNLKKIHSGKAVLVGFDRKINVTFSFLQELMESYIRKGSCLDCADDILIIQGTEDEVVSPVEVQKFADSNRIEFIPVDGADHRFQNPKHMDIATKKILEFFGF